VIGHQEDPDLTAACVVRAHRDGLVRDDDADREVAPGIRGLRTSKCGCCEPQDRHGNREQERERPQLWEASTAIFNRSEGALR
jgi:hypothetical protein